MKKITAILILALIAVSLTGCMRGEMDIKIKRNGKMDVSVLIATEEPSNLEKLLSDREIDLRRQEGWKIDVYSQDGYRGYLCTRSNVDVLAGEVTPGFNLGDGTFSKNDETYVLDINLYRGQDASRVHNYLKQVLEAGGKLTVTVTVPSSPVRHNATTVYEDGKTLYWDLLDEKTAGTVYVEYAAPGPMLYIAYVSGGILAAVILGSLINGFRSRKQNKKGDLGPTQYA